MSNTRWMLVVAALGALAVSGGDVLAKKGEGGKPGGGGDPPTNDTPLDIAFRFQETVELGVMQDDGTGLVALGGTGDVLGKAGWSPDGTELAFWCRGPDGDGVYVMGVDGTGLQRVVATNVAVGYATVAWSPVAAPDGKYKLAFLDEPVGASHRDAFIVNLDGTGLENVTQTSAHREDSVSWSPDAKQLAVDTNYTVRVVDLSRRDAGGVPQQFDVFSTYGVVPVNASSLKPGTAEWSKTGNEIVFSMFDDTISNPRHDLFVLDVSWSFAAGAWLGTTPVNITNTPYDEETQPSWSPDDSEIVFRNRKWKASGRGIAKPSLAIITTVTGARRTLFDGSTDIRSPVWKRSTP